MDPVRVFVYGTLMPGESRWPRLRPYAASWQPATTPGRIWDTGHGYPAAKFEAGGGEIPGVAVVVDDGRAGAALDVLDEIEAEGSLYRRVEISTSCGAAVSYAWIGPTTGLRLLPEGWRA